MRRPTKRTTSDPMNTELRRFICLDFEASALGPRSYPIEAGVADPVTSPETGSKLTRATLVAAQEVMCIHG